MVTSLQPSLEAACHNDAPWFEDSHPPKNHQSDCSELETFIWNIFQLQQDYHAGMCHLLLMDTHSHCSLISKHPVPCCHQVVSLAPSVSRQMFRRHGKSKKKSDGWMPRKERGKKIFRRFLWNRINSLCCHSSFERLRLAIIISITSSCLRFRYGGDQWQLLPLSLL